MKSRLIYSGIALPAVLIAGSLVGCRKHAHHRVRYIPSWEKPCAAVANELAADYYKTLPANTERQSENVVRGAFCEGFLEGFISPGSWISEPTEHDVHWHGFTAGQNYRRSHEDKLREVMEQFGYTVWEGDGTYEIRGFEMSLFWRRGVRIVDDYESDCWWIDPLVSDLPDVLGGNRMAEIHIVGFLSPEGRYGHLGMCKQQILVTKAWRLKNTR